MRRILMCMTVVAVTIVGMPTVFAQDRGVEVTFWNSVKDSHDPNELQAYLNKYPKGQFAELAAIRKHNLEKSKAVSVPAYSATRNQASKIENPGANAVAVGVDPKFDQYIARLKSLIGPRGRADIRKVLPVMLPVSALNMRKVDAMARQLFDAQFPSAGAIAISPAGQVAVGVSIAAYYTPPETIALSDCDSKRKGIENFSQQCEVFFKSRTIDTRVLFNMLEKVRGPDFDAWVKGLDESVATLGTRAPTVLTR